MKLVDMKCPRCGANIKVDSEMKEATCEFCRSSFILDDEVQHIQFDNMEKTGYDMEVGRRQAAQDEKERRKKEALERRREELLAKQKSKKGFPGGKRGLKIAGIVLVVLVVIGIVGANANKKKSEPVDYSTLDALTTVAPEPTEEALSDTTDSGEAEADKEDDTTEKEEKKEAKKKSEKKKDSKKKKSGNSASKTSASGVTPKVKKALDAYEEFMNSYIRFLKKYNEDPLSYMNEYTKMLKKYTKQMKKIEKMNQSDFTEADLEYYLKVTTRVTKKLAKVQI